MTEIGFSSIVRLWLRAFGAQPPSELVIASMTWFRQRQCRLSFLRNCLSSELRVGYCQYSRAFFALSATYFDISARHAFVRSRTPMILCLSNARSGDVHFDTSFVALHALVREIILNTIHTYIHDLSQISIDCLTPASRLRRSASVWINYVASVRRMSVRACVMV